ncbi:putative cation-transporting ATPase 13A5 [Halotydeus destructor]|nr:putative cation-transporting ATPase 13A5 [Halotydeus destructor]
MTPENKLKLIEELQNQGHQVGMCGDGANDCGALRAANAGISLSVAESSVASPFTYRDKNISCFPTLIKEGRATLAATFGSFKYQVSYCFVLLGAAMTLFWDGQKPSDAGYVFIDIILNILPPLVFGTTQASSVLTKRRPQRSLFAILPLFSTFSFVVIQVTIYVWAKQYLVQQAWYEPFKFDPTNVHRPAASYDQLTIISLNTMSYVIASIIFAPGEPFRKGFLSNKTYMLVVFINFSMIFFVTMYPAPDFILRWIKFKPVPSSDYKVLLFTISIVNFIICYTWEVLFVQRFVCDKMAARDTSRSSSRRFQVLERELDQDSDWPPLIGRTKSSEPKYSTTISIDEEETFNSKRRLPVWSEEDTGQDGGDAIELRQTAPRTFYTFSGTPRTSL